ncbi:hypothetical protein [Puniceibacterium confluentis]|uniref:hypothetical protein n=1 Tax=Puniceibacterium confluentis TaxID=1958944 RepID=UPI0011B55CF1|nr:hypothetical protein [Puniceibacterium confluentis]
MIVYGLPLLCYVGALIGTLAALRFGLARLVWGGLAVCVLLLGWAIHAGQAHQGWDAIGVSILAVLTVLPVFLGGVTGLLTGVYRSRKDRQKPPHD